MGVHVRMKHIGTHMHAHVPVRIHRHTHSPTHMHAHVRSSNLRTALVCSPRRGLTTLPPPPPGPLHLEFCLMVPASIYKRNVAASVNKRRPENTSNTIVHQQHTELVDRGLAGFLFWCNVKCKYVPQEVLAKLMLPHM